MIRVCYPKYEVACYDAFVQGSRRLTGLRGMIVIHNNLMIDKNYCDDSDGDGDGDGNDGDDGDDDDEGYKNALHEGEEELKSQAIP